MSPSRAGGRGTNLDPVLVVRRVNFGGRIVANVSESAVVGIAVAGERGVRVEQRALQVWRWWIDGAARGLDLRW
jgi:hypothetical protein